MHALLIFAAWFVALWFCWALVRLSDATSRDRRGSARVVHLGATAAVLCALALACYPSAPCVTSCGVTFQGEDCAGFERLERATVDAFGTCDAGSPDDACAALQDWTVRVLPESQTVARSNGEGRAFPAPTNAEAPDGGSLDWAFGATRCDTATVTLADEQWRNGVTATELIHAAERQCISAPDIYSQADWVQPGFKCVVSTAQRAPLVLTGASGGSEP